MRSVLYIGDFKDFWATENYVAHALACNGYEVFRVQTTSVPNARTVLGAALQYKVDFVMLSKGQFAESDLALALLKQQGIPTVSWIFDLFFDLPTTFGRRVPASSAFKTDLCFVTDGGHDEGWQQFGVNHRLLRQGIHEPDAHYGNPIPAHPPIVFLGTTSYSAREELIDALKGKYGKDFVHYGRGGDRREVRGQALNDVLASAKIVVGDSVPSDRYWSNRVYEVTGRGGFLMHPYVVGLEEEFEDGKHYVGFKHGDLRDLRAKIDYFLSHDAEREAIRKAGHERTKNNYTYTMRVEKMLQTIKQHAKREIYA